MKTIEITTLPEIVFAHQYGGDDYTNKFYPHSCRLEISYMAEGELTFYTDGVKITAKKGDIVALIGKGHEDYQDIKGVKYHFCEEEIILNYMVK